MSWCSAESKPLLLQPTQRSETDRLRRTPRIPNFHDRPAVLGAVKVRPGSIGVCRSTCVPADLDRPYARKEGLGMSAMSISGLRW